MRSHSHEIKYDLGDTEFNKEYPVSSHVFKASIRKPTSDIDSDHR